jgi:hypothetical protein
MRKSINPSRLTVVVFILSLLILVSGCQRGKSDNRWIEVLHKSDGDGRYTIYYDRISIDSHEPNIIRFWVKQKFSGYRGLSYSLYLIAINYKYRTCKISDIISYDLNEKVLPPNPTSRFLTSSTWVPMLPGHDVESIFIKIDQKEFGGLMEKIHAKPKS